MTKKTEQIPYQLLSIKEVAAMLKVTKPKALEIVKEGKIPMLQIDKGRFRLSDVLAYIEGQELPAEHTETKMPQLLNMRQVCKILQCSRITIHRLANSGQLRKIKVGRAVRFSADDVKSCIKAMTKG